MKHYLVKDVNNSFRFIPILEKKDCKLYLFIYHYELNFYKNLIANFGFINVKEADKNETNNTRTSKRK